MVSEIKCLNSRQFICSIGFILYIVLFIHGQQTNEPLFLQPNQIVERGLSGGETHTYRVELKKGELLQIRVEQKGIDVVVRLFEKNDKLAEIDSPNGTQGLEILFFIASESGVYKVEVGNPEAKVPKGQYSIFLETPRAATENDVKNSQAKNLVIEAQAQLGQRTAEAFQRARQKFLAANLIFRELNDKNNQAQTLFFAGFISGSLGEKQTALDYYNAALGLFQETSDTSQEIITLNNIGRIYDDLGNKQKALEYYNQALPLFQAIKDYGGEATVLNNIGLIYAGLGDKQKALEYYNRALPLFSIADNKNSEAATRNNIGKILLESGDTLKSLEYFKQALELFRAISNKNGEALMLNNIAGVYQILGEQALALEFLKKALPILRITGNKSGEAVALNNIGQIYAELYEIQKALDFLNQALPLFRLIGDKRGEATTLNNIGSIHDESKEDQKALEFYQQALTLFLSLGDKYGEATILNNIGRVNHELGDYQSALKILDQALTLYGQIGERSGESQTLGNIGSAYSNLGKRSEALNYFYQSLAIAQITGEKGQEAIILNNIMYEWGANPRMAIFYGKQTVNKNQELRGLSKDIDKEAQKPFLKRVQNSYMNLAELLIAEGEFDQAVQALSLYQDEQFFDLKPDTNSVVRQIDFSEREKNLVKRHLSALSKVGNVRLQLEDLKRKIDNRQPDVPEATQLQKLESKFKIANDDFLLVIKEIEKEFLGKPDEKDIVPPSKELLEMKDALGKLSASTKQKVGTIYNLSGKYKFYILLITSDEPVKHFETQIKSGELGSKVIQFHALLQSPTLDPRPVGKELYDIILKSVEPELKRQNIKTLMWQLDGNLRYIPMTALYDGKKYLLEKYRNVVITRADKEKIIKSANRTWTGTGFGSSQARKVDLFGDGDEIPFPRLPGVVEELNSIFRNNENSSGLLDGEIIVDKDFTKDRLYEALKKQQLLVHISSHFSFYPGNYSRSFLVLGDGFLTLNELKTQTDLFKGVELLTLSACNTAAIRSDTNGKEIDAFAELAQRLGAASVIATLWSVSDASTPWLMRDFYATRESKAGITKAEALQKAQLRLLNGKTDVKPFADIPKGHPNSNIKVVLTSDGKSDVTRGGETVFVDEKDAPPYIRDNKKPYAHPFYWSPFILYGNWR